MDLVDIIIILTTFLFILSGIQGIRLYRFTRLRQYLVFTIIFMLMGFDTYLISLDMNNTFLENSVSITYILLLHLIILEINPSRKTSMRNFSIVYIFLFLSFIGSYVIFERILMGSTALRLLIVDLVVIVVGFEHYLEFKSIKLIYINPRLMIGKKLWSAIGALFVVFGVIRSVAFLFIFANDEFGTTLPDLVQTTDPLIIIVYTTLALFMVLTINFLPEMYMIHKPYILSVLKLYNLTERESTSGLFSEFDSLERLKRYLQEISEKIV